MSEGPRGLGGHGAFKLFLIAWAGFGAGAGLLLDPVEAGLVSFCAATLLFYGYLMKQVRGSAVEDIRRRAEQNDAGARLFLVIMALVMLVVLGAITAEITGSKGGLARTLIGAIALVDAWIFANMAMTLHYANLYYGSQNGEDRGGLEFPHEKQPGYWEFAYYAFTIGMTFQTSDVDTTTGAMRRLTLFHALGAFLFNVGAIALAVNILAGSG
ncbi:DUF1345 domain-containing protein [Novosphingopyxis sp. YJ-S2-01]|uniref:DUF1345 domain-containing protein n=1 Tax=Novosphingopyxis sp. YJ-S2-01 TaxID=2794021 RepID=UPI0018DD0C22|nr:DUF1345 domain-containing protein [Novosphingopyxis sp. YJ-S2-01]